MNARAHTLHTVFAAGALVLSGCVGETHHSLPAGASGEAPERNNAASPPDDDVPQMTGGETTGEAPQDPEVLERLASIEVVANVPTLTEGEGTVLSVTLRDEDGAPMELVPLEWTSSDPSIAEAEGMGIVRALSAGEVSITAALGDITSNAVSLTVAPAPPEQQASVRVTPERVALNVQETHRLAAQVRRNGRTLIEMPTVTWESEDTSIVRVSGDGTLTAHALGTTTVHALYEGAQSPDITVHVTDAPEVPMVDWLAPSDDTQAGQTLAIRAGFKRYRTGPRPGFGVPYEPVTVEVLTADDTVLGTLTPSYGEASGDIDVSMLAAGEHELRIRAQAGGDAIMSQPLRLTRVEADVMFWEDIAKDDPVQGEDAEVFATSAGLRMLVHRCARECSIEGYAFNSERNRWEEMRYAQQDYRERDGAIEARMREDARLDLAVYVGWGWPSADARHLDAPNTMEGGLVATFSNRDAYRSFNDESLPDHYWFDCHVAQWRDDAGLDGSGGWDLLSEEDPDYLYNLPHPDTFTKNEQRHPLGVNAVRTEDCAHPRIVPDANGAHTVGYVSGEVPGTARAVHIRRWTSGAWVDAATPLTISGFEPVLHELVLDANDRPLLAVDHEGSAQVWRLGMDGMWHAFGDDAARAITSLHPLAGGGVLGGGVAGGDATVYIGSGDRWLALGGVLDIAPWAVVHDLQITERDGAFFALWTEGPERGNRDVYAARWSADMARWEVLGAGPLDAVIDEGAFHPEMIFDDAGHMIVRYTATKNARRIEEAERPDIYQRVRRSAAPVLTTTP